MIDRVLPCKNCGSEPKLDNDRILSHPYQYKCSHCSNGPNYYDRHRHVIDAAAEWNLHYGRLKEVTRSRTIIDLSEQIELADGIDK